MQILLTQPVSRESVEEIKALGYQVIDYREVQVTEDVVQDVEVVFGYLPFRFVDIEKFDKLEYILLSSAGINHLPLEVIKGRGIRLANNRGTFSIPIAEFVIMRMLEIVKLSRVMEKAQSEKEWLQLRQLDELSIKTIGILGTGSIGQATAERLKPFGCRIIGFNRSGRPVRDFDQVYKIEDYRNHIGDCDFVVISMPYTEATHHMIDKEWLKHMKETAFLINIGRGSIVDEAAMIEALKEERIAGAALDVFEEEPLPKASPLWEMENVLISGHTSAMSPKNDLRTQEKLLENLRRIKAGEGLVNEITISRGY